MIKNMVKNVLTVVGLVILLAAYALGFLSLYDFMNAMTAVVFLAVITLALEDVLHKAEP